MKKSKINKSKLIETLIIEKRNYFSRAYRSRKLNKSLILSIRTYIWIIKVHISDEIKTRMV